MLALGGPGEDGVVEERCRKEAMIRREVWEWEGVYAHAWRWGGRPY